MLKGFRKLSHLIRESDPSHRNPLWAAMTLNPGQGWTLRMHGLPVPWPRAVCVSFPPGSVTDSACCLLVRVVQTLELRAMRTSHCACSEEILDSWVIEMPIGSSFAGKFNQGLMIHWVLVWEDWEEMKFSWFPGVLLPFLALTSCTVSIAHEAIRLLILPCFAGLSIQ